MVDYSKAEMVDMDPARGFWVFAYGSLMWNPGFEAEEHALARLDGYHRSFCMASILYRGTPAAPGLVLALDESPGAFCAGVAYRIGPGPGPEVLEYLRERELVLSGYREVLTPLALSDGRSVDAIAYVIDQAHELYRGGLDLATQAEIIAGAEGSTGRNRDYLHNTVESLKRLGLNDPDLFELSERVERD